MIKCYKSYHLFIKIKNDFFLSINIYKYKFKKLYK